MADAPVSLVVVGAGAWGTMLAQLLAQNSALSVTLWARRAELSVQLTQTRETPYIPGLKLSERLTFTGDVNAVKSAEAVFVAVPSRNLRDVLVMLPPVRALVSGTKGLENSLNRPTEVMAEFQPQAALGALSGPNLVGELARGLPSSATVASSDATLAQNVQGWLNQGAFRVYTSADLVGLELGGALKNVIALAAGMCDGLGLGDNAKAALVTRGPRRDGALRRKSGRQRRDVLRAVGAGRPDGNV